MGEVLKFKSSAAAYHGLSLAVGNAREGSKAIRVSKAALNALLDDHGAACAKLKALGIEYREAASLAGDADAGDE